MHAYAEGHVLVAGFYRFTGLDNLKEHKVHLLDALRPLGIRGSILLAPEGINATIAGSNIAIRSAMQTIRALPGCDDVEPFLSQSDAIPFQRFKVRIKREIVSLRNEHSAHKSKRQFADNEAWNALLQRDDVAVLDLRNAYETSIGSFDGAIDPKLQSFGEFPEWWRKHAQEFEGKQLAMFCTGGIRCEKAAPYLEAQGIDDVIQLKGGILRYLDDVPEDQSKWHGACFVFDERVALGHGLKPSGHTMCGTCGRPLLLSGDTVVVCACGQRHPD